MEKKNFGFAGIIAFVAMACTVVAQAGVFEIKGVRVADCFFPTFEIKKSPCSLPVVEIVQGDPCTAVKNADHLYSISGVMRDPQIWCDGGNFICCIRIEVDANPCPGQPQFGPSGIHPLSYYKVSSVFCKSKIE